MKDILKKILATILVVTLIPVNLVSVKADTKKEYYTVLEPTLDYDEVEGYVNNSFIVVKNELYGLVNIKGREIIECKYKSLYYREKTNLIEAEMPDNTCIVFDVNGKELCNLGKHDGIFTDANVVIVYNDNEEDYTQSYQQVYDTKGKLIFDNVKGYWGSESGEYYTINYLNDDNEYIYDSQYKLIRKINNSYSLFGVLGDKYIVYSDRNTATTKIESFDGKFSVSLNGFYNGFELFGDKILLYKRNDGQNVCCYNLSDKSVTYLPKADRITKVSDDKYISTLCARDEEGRINEGRYTNVNNIYDLSGKAVFNNIKDYIGSIDVLGDSNEYCFLYDGNTGMLIDLNGKILIDKVNASIYNSFGDYFETYKNVIKADGTVIINKDDFEKIGLIDNEYFAGCVKGKWGFYKIGKEPVKESVKTEIKVKKPEKVKLKSASNIKTKKVKLVWKRVKNISGYQLVYAQNKKFTKVKKTVNLKKSAKTKTIKKLKKKKTYYFKIRAYKKVNNKKYYGKWSNIKKVKIRK